MAYHTPVYLLLFLPAVLLAYQITPQKKRWLLLLGASWIFFWSVSGKLLIFLIGTILFTHYIGLGLETLKSRCRLEAGKPENDRKQIQALFKKRQRLVLAAGIFGLLAVLGYLKYYNFFCPECESAAGKSRPSGPSFSQKSGAASGNFLLYPAGRWAIWRMSTGRELPPLYIRGKLALCLSFFPQLMEGPHQFLFPDRGGSLEGQSHPERKPGGGSLADSVGTF